MEEIYKFIEDKIKASGYYKPISGFDIYNDISEQIEDKEEGDYILLSQLEDCVTFEYKLTIMEEEFNLSYIHIVAPEGEFHINLDESL